VSPVARKRLIKEISNKTTGSKTMNERRRFIA
jgi:hypothetical protein